MAEPTLEQRVAALEQEVAGLKSHSPGAKKQNWMSAVLGQFQNDPVFEEMLAYGRYFRTTGCEPPPDWKPGDPIPEPDGNDAT